MTERKGKPLKIESFASVADRMGVGPARFATPRADGGWDIEVRPPAHLKAPPRTVSLTNDQYLRFRRWASGSGDLLQNILSDLSAHERDIIMYGGIELPGDPDVE